MAKALNKQTIAICLRPHVITWIRDKAKLAGYSTSGFANQLFEEIISGKLVRVELRERKTTRKKQ